MLNFLSRLSARLRLGLVIGLLTLLLMGTLYAYITSTRAAADDAREINRTTLIRESSTRIELLARQITTTSIDNQNVVLAFDNEISSLSGLLVSINGLFGASETVSRDEFATFAADLRTEYPQVRTIQYVQQVPASIRRSYEQATELEGFVDFQIFEYSAGNEKIPALEREAYYPMTYVVPAAANRRNVGFDLGSNPILLAAMEEARDTGQSVASAPILVELSETESLYTIQIFSPIYTGNEVPDEADARRDALVGFTVLEVDMEALISTALGRLAEGGIILQIDDVTRQTAVESVYINTRFSFTLASGIVSTTFPTRVLGRDWIVTIPQGVDVEASTQELQTLTNDMNERIIALQEGSAELGLIGLRRHTNPEIITAYEELTTANEVLQRNISNFLGTEDSNERVGLLPAIQDNTVKTIGSVERLVNLLEDEVEQSVDRAAQLSIAVAAVGVFIVLFGILTVYQIAANLLQVNRTALALAEGQLQTRVPVRGRDELGQIGTSMNVMADRLQEFIDTLEVRVAERTRDLQAVADVNTQIGTVLQVDRLLQDVVDLTKERFGLYHSHIYLLNETEDALALTVGAGHVGRQMVSEGRIIRLNNPGSIVAEAARSRQGVVINDVGETPLFLPHPLLPNTRSELAVALVARGRLLGVLDVQSDRPGHFTAETLDVFGLLASQIAIALDNASLYQEAERTSRHEQALGTITQRLQSATSVDEVLQVAVRELGKALRVPHTAIELEVPVEK